jgi:GTP-binding protein LepA
MMSTGSTHDTLEVGVISPEPTPTEGLSAGEVGYLITGVKNVRQARVGDTVTSAASPAAKPLAGYAHPRPMVFSGLYPLDGDEYPDLRDALDKLQLNDASLVYEPETSLALGFGFRCGFLGLLHMEIVRERLER